MFPIFSKTLLKFFSCPNSIKAAEINTWFQFTPGQRLLCHHGQKRNGRFGHYFVVYLVIILPQFGK